jgi:tetratricopeptide (TPR) repeat protein
LKLGRLEDALVCDDKALDIDASNPELWHQKGLTLKHLRRHEEALACYDQALELEKRNPAYWSDRGLVLGTLERHEDAISSLERSIDLAPQAAAPWLNKALSEETLNRDADAVESYKRFVELASPDLLSHIQHANLRIAALQAKMGAGASAPLTGAETGGGGAPSAFVAGGVTGAPAPAPINQDWFQAARSLEQAGRYEDSIDTIDQGLAAEPEKADAWYMRGCCLQHLGELEEAVASLDRSLELDPKRAEAWYHKGVSEQLSGATTEAAQSLEKFLSLASPDEHRPLIADVRHRLKKLGSS